MPDERPRPAVAVGLPRRASLDLIDGLCEFARAYPAWIDRDGRPLSWPLYQYGMAHLHRAALRHQLQHAQAVRFAGVVQEDWPRVQDELRSRAGD